MELRLNSFLHPHLDLVHKALFLGLSLSSAVDQDASQVGYYSNVIT